MLLLELDIVTAIIRCSNADLSLTEPWDRYVKSFPSLRVGISNLWGGMVVPDFGEIEFTPDLELPVSVACRILFTLTTEEDAQLLVEGTLHRSSISRKYNVYNLYVPAREAVLISNEVMNNTLTNIMSWACDATRLNLTLDTTLARNPSPTVNYTTDSDVDLLELIEEMAAFYHHWIRIDKESGTLHLVDMETVTATRTLEVFDHLPSTYSWENPVKCVRSNGDPSYRVVGDTYGREESFDSYDSSQAGTEAALTKILACIQAGRCELRMGLDTLPPALGEQINWVDTNMERPVSATIQVHTLLYDFNNYSVVIEGWGTVTQ